MSTPLSTVLPRCARRVDLPLPNGPLAAIEARPDRPAVAATLMVPGFTGSKEDFLHILEPLTAAGVHVLAIDQRGQCDSTGLADPAGYAESGAAGQGYGSSVFASDIRALVRRLAAETQQPVHLLGHSFGGHTVREAVLGAHFDAEAEAGQGPSRGGLLPLASVTFLDSGPAAVLGKASRDRLELLLSVADQLTLRQIHELSPMDQHPDPHVSAFLLHRWLANDPGSIFAMARRLLHEPDRTDDLKALLDAWNLPCLIMTGIDEDVWSAQLLRETADRLGAEFAVIPGAGHSPNTDQPGLVADSLLEFWLG